MAEWLGKSHTALHCTVLRPDNYGLASGVSSEVGTVQDSAIPTLHSVHITQHNFKYCPV